MAHVPHSGSRRIDALGAIVMGLHWDPPSKKDSSSAADLDALCASFDERGRLLDVVHPGRTRDAGGAIVHTGDSVTGASTWDDERIFVFLDALPANVAELAFIVTSNSDRSFEEIRGASCHISMQEDEEPLASVDLTSLRRQKNHIVAIARREASSWTLK